MIPPTQIEPTGIKNNKQQERSPLLSMQVGSALKILYLSQRDRDTLYVVPKVTEIGRFGHSHKFRE